MPEKLLKLIPDAVEDVAWALRRFPRAQERFERVTDLDGFDSAFRLELLSTVHWALEHDAPRSRNDLIALTQAWNERKKSFSPLRIGQAAEVLTEKGWIDCAELACPAMTTDTSESKLERLICTALAGHHCEPPEGTASSHRPVDMVASAGATAAITTTTVNTAST